LFEFECGWGELDNEEMIKEDEQENMEEIWGNDQQNSVSISGHGAMLTWCWMLVDEWGWKDNILAYAFGMMRIFKWFLFIITECSKTTKTTHTQI
jgi:hypothetical protein